MTTNASDSPDLGTLIDSLYNLRSERLEVEKKIKEMKTQELSLRVSILRALEAVGLDGAKGKGATASVIYEEQPKVEDWSALYAFIEENDAFRLLQRRVSSTSVKEFWDAGLEIPGVSKFVTTDLSLTKRNK